MIKRLIIRLACLGLSALLLGALLHHHPGHEGTGPLIAASKLGCHLCAVAGGGMEAPAAPMSAAGADLPPRMVSSVGEAAPAALDAPVLPIRAPPSLFSV